MKILIDKFPDNEDTGLIKLSAEYVQEPDTCSESDNINQLFVEIEGGGLDAYYIIKTGRWAFNSIDELVQVLEDFKKRFKEDK